MSWYASGRVSHGSDGASAVTAARPGACQQGLISLRASNELICAMHLTRCRNCRAKFWCGAFFFFFANESELVFCESGRKCNEQHRRHLDSLMSQCSKVLKDQWQSM